MNDQAPFNSGIPVTQIQIRVPPAPVADVAPQPPSPPFPPPPPPRAPAPPLPPPPFAFSPIPAEPGREKSAPPGDPGSETAMHRAGPSVIMLALPGTGKTTHLVSAMSFLGRAAHPSSCENRLTLRADVQALRTLTPLREKLVSEGTFPDGTHDHQGLTCYLFCADATTGEEVHHCIETVDTTGGAFQGLSECRSDTSKALLERMKSARGLVFLVDVRNLGQGARAIEHVLGAGLARLAAHLLDEAQRDRKTLQSKIAKNISVVVSQVDRLVEARSEGNDLLFELKRRPREEASTDGEYEAELCDLPPDVHLGLEPQDVRTYLFDHCGDAGRRLVQIVEKAFVKVRFFAASAVGMTLVAGEWRSNMIANRDRPRLRSTRVEPIGLLEPFAWAFDPSALDRAAEQRGDERGGQSSRRSSPRSAGGSERTPEREGKVLVNVIAPIETPVREPDTPRPLAPPSRRMAIAFVVAMALCALAMLTLALVAIRGGGR